MDIWELMKNRHAVRRYTGRPIEAEAVSALEGCIEEGNREGNLHMQLCLDEPKAFGSGLHRYGLFRGVRNYIALVGGEAPDLDRRCGYYGERVVLEAARLGLNTCWVGLTYAKGKTACRVDPGERLCCVIAVGYGETQGMPHKVKPLEILGQADGGSFPDWFRQGLEAAQLAPTALNQQKFRFILHGDRVEAQAGNGSYTHVDLGIAQCHFELASPPENWRWME